MIYKQNQWEERRQQLQAFQDIFLPSASEGSLKTLEMITSYDSIGRETNYSKGDKQVAPNAVAASVQNPSLWKNNSFVSVCSVS